MINLNDFLDALKSGLISKEEITIVRDKGKIVDYVLPQEKVREYEHTEKLPLSAIVAELFDLQ